MVEARATIGVGGPTSLGADIAVIDRLRSRATTTTPAELVALLPEIGRSRTFVAYVTGRCSRVVVRDFDSGREKQAAAAKGLTCLTVAPFAHGTSGLRLDIHRSGLGGAGTATIEDVATWFDLL